MHSSTPVTVTCSGHPEAVHRWRVSRRWAISAATSSRRSAVTPLSTYPMARETPNDAWLSLHAEVMAKRAPSGPNASVSTAARICLPKPRPRTAPVRKEDESTVRSVGESSPSSPGTPRAHRPGRLRSSVPTTRGANLPVPASRSDAPHLAVFGRVEPIVRCSGRKCAHRVGLWFLGSPSARGQLVRARADPYDAHDQSVDEDPA